MRSNLISVLCFLLSLANPLSAQWVKTNGPEGITVSTLFESGSTLFCGTNAQGVYRSSDNGNTWVFSGLPNKWVYSFEKDNTYLYAGGFSFGVYRSSDNGLTWQPANNGIQNEAVFYMLNAGGYLWAGTVGNGLFRSSDQGNTWVDANGGALGGSFIKAMFYQDGRINVEADNLVFYSYDSGNSWYLDSEEPIQYNQIYDFYQQGDTILASGFNTFFRSTDGGIHWSNAYYFNSSIVGFDRIGNTVYAGGGKGVYYTNDWGLTWTTVPTTGLRRGAADFIISTNNNFLVGREEIGIAISSNTGSSWSEISLTQFARASSIDNAMTTANGILYSGTHGNGVFSSPDQGNSWTKIGTPNIFDTLSSEIIFSILHIEPNIILARGCGDGLFRSADNGATWTHITAGLPVEGGTDFTCVHTLEKCGPNILAALWMGVYYSTDNGLTWNPTNLLSPAPAPGFLDAGGFAIRDNIACVGIASYPMQSGVYRSTDYGVTWSLADPIADIMFMATGGNHTMYAGELFTSYVSYDDGLTWNGLGLGAAFTILAFDQYAFIGNNNGLFFSNNYGASWTLMNQGLDPYPNNAVQGLTRDNTYVYAGLYRDAIWRRPLSDFGIIPPCPTVVTNTNDSGSGSLRDIISCSLNGANITFSNALTDQTITLTTGEININKNLTLSGLGMMNLTLSGNNSSRVFHILPGSDLEIKNMALKNATSITNGGALFIEGNSTLENILLQNNFENGLARGMTVISPGLIQFKGIVDIKN